ncbi:MAG: hypothetical protein AB8H86_29250 [Polyangiales bacterium]
MAFDRIRCERCGSSIDSALLAQAGRLTCPSCRHDGPLPPTQARAVKGYFLRLARATQRMRVALRIQHLAKMMAQPGCLGIGCLGALAGVAVAGLGVLLVSGILDNTPATAPDTERMLAGVWFMGGLLVALVAGLMVPVSVFGWGFRRATFSARAQALEVPLNFQSQCRGCTAPVPLPIWQGASPLPCPYCRTPLVPDAPTRERLAKARDAEGRAIGEQAMARFEQSIAALSGSHDKHVRDRPQKPNGKLTASADGIWEAEEGPVSMWSTTEMYPGRLLMSFEVSAELPVLGTLWIVPTKAPERHREIAPSRGFPIPDQQAKSPFKKHTVWTDGDLATDFVQQPRFVELVRSLGANESLRIDPGGVSFWDIGRSGFRARNWLYNRWARKRSELTTDLVAFFG